MIDARYCSQCGEPLESRFRFCPVCGVETDETAAEPLRRTVITESPVENKVTPISPEARRVLQEFDARMQALKERHRKQTSNPFVALRNALSPKVQLIITLSTIGIFVAFVLTMIWVSRILENFLKVSGQ